MARDLGELNREDFARYKDDVKKEGKPFFPCAMFHDTVMSLVVVCVIIALAAIWYFDADGVEAGDPRPLVHGAGRARDDRLHPASRLVLLLPLLPPPDLQVAGDGLHRDRRHPDDLPHPPHRPAVLRPASRAAAVAPPGGDGRGRPHDPLDGRPHVEGRDREGGARLRARRCSSPSGPRSRASRTTRRPCTGAEIFAQSGCLNCHTYLGQGAGNLGAPDLSDDRGDERRRVLRPVPDQPGGVREQRDGLVLVPRRGEPGRARRVPRRLQGADSSRRRDPLTRGSRSRTPEPPSRRSTLVDAQLRLVRARLPRRDRRVRRSLRRAPPAGARGGRLRDRPRARRGRGSRCSRPSSTAIRRSRARRCSSGSSGTRPSRSPSTGRTTSRARTRAARRASTPT